MDIQARLESIQKSQRRRVETKFQDVRDDECGVEDPWEEDEVFEAIEERIIKALTNQREKP